jgi:hypothetical protein
MEMLIFFFICLFAGVFAAYYSEHFTVVSRDSVSYEPTNQQMDTIMERLRRIKSQIH